MVRCWQFGGDGGGGGMIGKMVNKTCIYFTFFTFPSYEICHDSWQIQSFLEPELIFYCILSRTKTFSQVDFFLAI